MGWICVGPASTLGGGEVGGLLGWIVVGKLVGWIPSWRLGRFVGGWKGSSLVVKEGSGVRGLQLLATTVSSASSLSVRMLEGLLLKVWCWCTSGMFLMIVGAVILFNVIPTQGWRIGHPWTWYNHPRCWQRLWCLSSGQDDC